MAAVKASIAVEAGGWGRWAGPAARRAIKATAAELSVDAAPAEVAVLLTDDAAMRALNRTWRGQDKPTNVLSFPAAPSPARATRALGDIVVAYETVMAEAVAHGKSAEQHLSHLIVHGFLHLLGYDHENDADAAKMEDCERRILATLGIADPYASMS